MTLERTGHAIDSNGAMTAGEVQQHFPNEEVGYWLALSRCSLFDLRQAGRSLSLPRWRPTSEPLVRDMLSGEH